MAYVTGNIIRKGDYNILATGSEDGTLTAGAPSAGLLWGTGFGPYGYGQSDEYIAPVEVGDVVTKDEWNNLDAVIVRMRDHQQGPGTYAGQYALDTGELIRPRSTYAPNIQLAYDNVGLSYSSSDDAPVTSSYTATWGQQNSTTLKLIHTVTFPTADAARHFFNAGGKLKLSFSTVASVTTPRTLFWTDMCQAAGTIVIGYKNTLKNDSQPGDYYGDKDFVLDQDNGGFWAHRNVGSSLVKHFQQNYVGYAYQNYSYDYRYGYGSDLDYLKVEMSVTDNDNINGNLGKTVTVIASFVNGSALSPIGNYNDTMVSSMRSNLVVSRPSAAFLDTAPWLGYTIAPSQVIS